jgi:hypothetical protein
MVSISVSARSLAAARRIDPDVSTAAVQAAVEAALDAVRREAGRPDGQPAPPQTPRG